MTIQDIDTEKFTRLVNLMKEKKDYEERLEALVLDYSNEVLTNKEYTILAITELYVPQIDYIRNELQNIHDEIVTLRKERRQLRQILNCLK